MLFHITFKSWNMVLLNSMTSHDQRTPESLLMAIHVLRGTACVCNASPRSCTVEQARSVSWPDGVNGDLNQAGFSYLHSFKIIIFDTDRPYSILNWLQQKFKTGLQPAAYHFWKWPDAVYPKLAKLVRACQNYSLPKSAHFLDTNVDNANITSSCWEQIPPGTGGMPLVNEQQIPPDNGCSSQFKRYIKGRNS